MSLARSASACTCALKQKQQATVLRMVARGVRRRRTTSCCARGSAAWSCFLTHHHLKAIRLRRARVALAQATSLRR
eukprot:11452989-Alexandrium_andersonii.AAC.1